MNLRRDRLSMVLVTVAAAMLLTLLPLPAGYARQTPRIRFVAGVLEVRVEAPR